MKYTCSIVIEKPIAEVISLWDNPTYYEQWQDGFKSIELLKGEYNTVGAKSKILFDGKVKMELMETLITVNLPAEKTALYEHIHMSNTQTTRFEALATDKTKYISEVNYTQFNTILVKIMAKCFPSMFKKQSQKWMTQFKKFAEEKINF